MRDSCVRLVVLLGALLSTSVLAGCNMKEAEGKTKEAAAETAKSAAEAALEKEKAAIIPVQAAKPERASISDYFETTTRIVAERRVEVIAEGIGQCLSVTVEEGDIVKKGQVLAELDRQEMDAGLAQARVNVQQTKYQMEKAKEQSEKGILSSFEAENARFMHEQAVATLKVQEVRITKQTVTAPIDGVVTRRNLQTGQMVAAGVPAFSIVDPASYILPINPPEKELPRLSIGQQARVTIDSDDGREFMATVRRINPSVDPMSGTVKVTLDFSEEDRAQLRESAFARVRLIKETHTDTLLVPKDVIIEENARRYLMIIVEEPGEAEGSKKLIAKRIEIQVGLEDKDRIEVTAAVDEGKPFDINEDTTFVTLGHQTLKAGSQVAITSTEAEVAARAGSTVDEALEAATKKADEQKEEERKRNLSDSGLGGGGGAKRRALNN